MIEYLLWHARCQILRERLAGRPMLECDSFGRNPAQDVIGDITVDVAEKAGLVPARIHSYVPYAWVSGDGPYTLPEFLPEEHDE